MCLKNHLFIKLVLPKFIVIWNSGLSPDSIKYQVICEHTSHLQKLLPPHFHLSLGLSGLTAQIEGKITAQIEGKKHEMTCRLTRCMRPLGVIKINEISDNLCQTTTSCLTLGNETGLHKAGVHTRVRD